MVSQMHEVSVQLSVVKLFRNIKVDSKYLWINRTVYFYSKYAFWKQFIFDVKLSLKNYSAVWYLQWAVRSGIPPGEMASCVVITYCLFTTTLSWCRNPILSSQVVTHNHHSLCDLIRKKVDMETLAGKHGGSSLIAEPFCHKSTTPD